MKIQLRTISAPLGCQFGTVRFSSFVYSCSIMQATFPTSHVSLLPKHWLTQAAGFQSPRRDNLIVYIWSYQLGLERVS